MSAIIQCKCVSKEPGDAASVQDKLYGVGNRVANATVKGDDKQIEVRCTVCSTNHRIPRSRNK